MENANGWQQVETFTVTSAAGNERQAMQRVADLVADSGLQPTQLDRLKTAVAEATMNAMEHGNQYDPDKPVEIEVWRSPGGLRVTISDEGSGPEQTGAAAPDLLAKLAGEQSPRGWGLFLIQNMVDDMQVHQDADRHTVELTMYLDKEQ
jgi:anti-sigma regulatory factor (Ser/Thr protein kinase)